MKTKSFVGIIAGLGLAGALAVACSSSTEEAVACDPQTDPSCVGADTGTGSETTAGDTGTAAVDTGGGGIDLDASVPQVEVGTGGGFPDGSIVLADGAIKLPDGNVVGPDALTGCVAGTTQCTNCKDDDSDGLVDWLDPECTGPLDNDEGSYATGIPGDNKDACKQDCWFDGNSGSGNDGCLFPTKCLPGSTEPSCPYDPTIVNDPKECPKPTAECIKYCQPLTPKGCDCAGCCQVFDAAGQPHTVKLSGTCSTENLNDPTKCPVCTQIAECSNPCGECDWCLGKTSLPPQCYPPPPDAGPPVDAGTYPDGAPIPPPDTGTPQPPPDAGSPNNCPVGLLPCSPTQPCATGTYCLTGCCIKPPS